MDKINKIMMIIGLALLTYIIGVGRQEYLESKIRKLESRKDSLVTVLCDKAYEEVYGISRLFGEATSDPFGNSIFGTYPSKGGVEFDNPLYELQSELINRYSLLADSACSSNKEIKEYNKEVENLERRLKKFWGF